ncbi:MAG: polysaccharide biosynthesis/export family protein [Paludibacteraceae bacterium]
MTYFREVDSTTADSVNKVFESQIDPVIKAGDALTITVSALDQEAVVPYNLPTVAFASPGMAQLTTAQSMQYYIVDAEGKIEFPVLGTLQVLGMKTTEVANMIGEKLSAQVKDPMVLVRLINAKVTVMGEVNHPGQYTMPNGRMTLLDALGAAGDLSPYGQRDNVLITRETNGKLEFCRLNLNSDELFTSPYYYLQQNDVIYVSPNKVRAINSTNVNLWLSVISTVASATTVVVTVVNAAK